MMLSYLWGKPKTEKKNESELNPSQPFTELDQAFGYMKRLFQSNLAELCEIEAGLKLTISFMMISKILSKMPDGAKYYIDLSSFDKPISSNMQYSFPGQAILHQMYQEINSSFEGQTYDQQELKMLKSMLIESVNEFKQKHQIKKNYFNINDFNGEHALEAALTVLSKASSDDYAKETSRRDAIANELIERLGKFEDKSLASHFIDIAVASELFKNRYCRTLKSWSNKVMSGGYDSSSNLNPVFKSSSQDKLIKFKESLSSNTVEFK